MTADQVDRSSLERMSVDERREWSAQRSYRIEQQQYQTRVSRRDSYWIAVITAVAAIAVIVFLIVGIRVAVAS